MGAGDLDEMVINQLYGFAARREASAKLVNQVAREISKLRPLWINHPLNLQIDTQNYCNLKCAYCNVREGSAMNLPRGTMPMETIQRILEYWRGTPMWCVAPFSNGEPLLETRLPEINDMIQKTVGCMSVIDTNGSIYANRELLVHPNMRLVRFTVSAATRETYNKTMGVDLFPDVLSTVEWFKNNRYNQQKMMIQFVSNKHNEHEIDKWVKLFKGQSLRIVGLHRNPEFQKASEDVLGEKLTNSAERVILIDAEGKTSFEKLKPNYPCSCWDIQSFGCDGSITQCVKFPYSFNYGNVVDTDLRKAWDERNRNAMNNPCCRGCNTRSPDSVSILKKWGGGHVQ